MGAWSVGQIFPNEEMWFVHQDRIRSQMQSKDEVGMNFLLAELRMFSSWSGDFSKEMT